jgi:hypothetical protein
MDALWPLELVRYAADKMIMPGMDRGFGKSVGERFPDVFNIDVPSIFYSRMEVLGLPTGDARLYFARCSPAPFVQPFSGRVSLACISLRLFLHRFQFQFDVGMTVEDVVDTFKSHGVALEEKNVTRMSEFRRESDIRTSTKLVFGTPEQAREVRCIAKRRLLFFFARCSYVHIRQCSPRR